MTDNAYPAQDTDAVAALIARSNRLGRDPKNTNYAGGNASAKGTETDPVTGQPAELLWVKGSGGDLGTLTAVGLAVLRLDALRAAQLAGDVLESNAVLMDAYNTDVRPLLAELREEMGLAPEPVKAYLASGYGEKMVAQRVGGTAAGWGA